MSASASAVAATRSTASPACFADHPSPSETEIRHGLEGNLCRCTGYHNIVKAVQAVASA